MLDLMLRRRSVRKFTAEPVSEANRERILSAGLITPSSMGKNPVELVAVTDRDTILSLKQCKPRGGQPLEEASFVVAVLADSDLSDVWVEDASIAATYIMLEAEQLGLGCTWLQIRNREGTTAPSEDMVRALLGAPKNMGVLCMMCIGHKNEEKLPYTEADIRLSKLHREIW